MGCSFFPNSSGSLEVALPQPLKLSVISPLPRPHSSSAAATAGPCTQCSATSLLSSRPRTRSGGGHEGHSNTRRQWQQRAGGTGAAVPRFAIRAPPISCVWDGSGVSLSGGGSHGGPAHAGLAIYLQFGILARRWQQEETSSFGQRAFAASLAAGAAADRTVAPASAARRGPSPWSRAGPPAGDRVRGNSRGAGKGHGGVEMHRKLKMTYTRSTRDKAEQTVHFG